MFCESKCFNAVQMVDSVKVVYKVLPKKMTFPTCVTAKINMQLKHYYLTCRISKWCESENEREHIGL